MDACFGVDTYNANLGLFKQGLLDIGQCETCAVEHRVSELPVNHDTMQWCLVFFVHDGIRAIQQLVGNSAQKSALRVWKHERHAVLVQYVDESSPIGIHWRELERVGVHVDLGHILLISLDVIG